jgi:hypothetical protein
MTLPDILVLDNVLPKEELEKWQARVSAFTEQSNPNSAKAMVGELLLHEARNIVGDIMLVHAPIFAIKKGQDPTEMHQDVGEYAVLFYPFDCPTGPLRTDRGLVAVKANRLVAINVTTITHQQIIPIDDTTRYSVAMKFNPLRTQTEEDRDLSTKIAADREFWAYQAEHPEKWIA